MTVGNGSSPVALASAVPNEPDRVEAPSGEAEYEERVTERVEEVVRRRAVIEQAKGMFALVYGLDDDGSFMLLVWISQRSNRKLKSVAVDVVSHFRALGGPVLPPRKVFDNTLILLLQK